MKGNTNGALVIKIKSHRVSDKVFGTRLKTKLVVDGLHGVLIQVNA